MRVNKTKNSREKLKTQVRKGMIEGSKEVGDKKMHHLAEHFKL